MVAGGGSPLLRDPGFGSLLLRRGAPSTTSAPPRAWATWKRRTLFRRVRGFDRGGGRDRLAVREDAGPGGTGATPTNPRQRLVYAAAWGRCQAADFLMDRGAAVNLIPAGFDYAGTPLHYAAFRGRREMVTISARVAIPRPRHEDRKLAEDWAEHSKHKEHQGSNGCCTAVLRIVVH